MARRYPLYLRKLEEINREKRGGGGREDREGQEERERGKRRVQITGGGKRRERVLRLKARSLDSTCDLTAGRFVLTRDKDLKRPDVRSTNV